MSWWLAVPVFALGQPQPPRPVPACSISELEEHLVAIDAKLNELASFSLRGGTGAIGYRSYWESPEQWIELDLGHTCFIDEIVLVPCLWRHPTKGFLADAFPLEFRILAGVGPDAEGVEIASYRTVDGTSKGIDPLVIPISRVAASWVRIEATGLSERNFDGAKVLQLSELLIFSGAENVALQQPVTASSSDRRGMSGAWHERFLVDGFVPYLMDSAKGVRSNAFIAIADRDSHLTLDLGTEKPISRIHLHAVEQSDTVPQAYPGDLGIPKRMLIYGANQPDFSDAIELVDLRKDGMLETGPILVGQFPEANYRYVRVVPHFEDPVANDPSPEIRIGFAEIEILSRGNNVALGSKVTSQGLHFGQRSLAAMTDGNNLYGEILSLRDWMNELAERGALERARPIVLAELNLRYEKQKTLLARMIQLVFLLLVTIGFVILIDRHLQLRKVNQVRERIAADLHDELGANIQTIGLVSDMAKNALDSREELVELLDQIRIYTEKSGEAARYCTNILEARGICEDLVGEMMQVSNRMLADLEHDTSFMGEETLKRLDPHKRIDLLLFYKECLTNILRHSGATKVSTWVEATPKVIAMNIRDNGKGLVAGNSPPPSLIRRAKLLRAKVSAEPVANGGTQINLVLKIRKNRFHL